MPHPKAPWDIDEATMPMPPPPDIDPDKDPEWILHFCNFIDSWTVPPKPGGKRMGDGIVVVHPDTGWTLHPELWDSFRIVDGKQADDRYLIHQAKDFMDPSGLADDKLLETGLTYVPPTGKRTYFSQGYTTAELRHPSHGIATASVLMSKRGAPDFDAFPDYPIGPGFVTGVVPLAKVIPYRVTNTVVLDHEASNNLAKCIYYAVHLSQSSTILHSDGSQIGVVSISLGSLDALSRIPSLEKALVAARLAGVVVVAAAGQAIGERTGSLMSDAAYPGNDPNTICVAGCNIKQESYRKGFYGPSVDITAPADEIWQARAKRPRVVGHTNDYSVTQSDGTSYACAIVAGACALWQAHHGRANLLREYGPELVFDLFKKVLVDSCDTSLVWRTENPGAGAGILNAKNLLLHTLPPKSEIASLRNR